MSEFYLELQERLAKQKDLEEKIDELRRFKNQHFKILKAEILNHAFDLPFLSENLTQLADAIFIISHEIAFEEIRKVYGFPRFRDNQGNFLSGEIAFIAMGKLGGCELHFNSDLDVIFVFNRNGETMGGKQITNQEFYSRLTQRIINYLTLYTQYGYAYKVDTELRPSGNAGVLVTAIDTWTTYYHQHAAIWERQALLKARLIHATGPFSQEFKGLFNRLIFIKPFPSTLASEIHRLRMRIEKELAKESSSRWHFKKGFGGLMDIEFTVQYLQLKMGKIFPDILHTNTLTSLEAFEKRKIFNPEDLLQLKEAYSFYRKLEIYLEVGLEMREGYIDLNKIELDEIAKKMDLSSKENLIDKLDEIRKNTRKIYLKTLRLDEE